MASGKSFFQRKTTWAVLGTILAAVGGLVTGDVTTAQTIQTIGVAIIGLFIRDSIS